MNAFRRLKGMAVFLYYIGNDSSILNKKETSQLFKV